MHIERFGLVGERKRFRLNRQTGTFQRASCAVLSAADSKGMRGADIFFTPGMGAFRAFSGRFRVAARFFTPTAVEGG